MASVAEERGVPVAEPPKGRPPGEEEALMLRELCTVNGINYDKLSVGAGAKVKLLEIFFFSCPRIVGLRHFPSLSALCIVNQRFSLISGLEGCRQLQELWVCETQVKEIEGLSQCTRLVKLYLYSNEIGHISGLKSLTQLEVLWLNNNRIKTIEGLENQCSLRDLNLAGNSISSLGSSLSHLANIEVLNLSGNTLTSLKDLVGLASLPCLHTLALCDPMYPANPACQLCNYSTYILYHMPHLQWLDGKEVVSHDLHRLVKALVEKKKQFYRMKVHRVCMRGEKVCRSLRARLSSLQRETYSRMRSYHHQLKTLKYAQSDEARVKLLKERLEQFNKHLQWLECRCQEVCSRVKAQTEDDCQRWMCELESGGNVKFTSGDPSLPWFKSCSELTSSRFSVAEFQGLGISGLEVREVVRVENRLLYTRFKEKLKVLLESEPYVSMVPSYKHLLDYLFLVWTPGVSFNALCSDGFPLGDSPLHLTNSVNLADTPRLTHTGLSKGQSSKGALCRVLQGQLLLCKVFVGQTVQAKGNASITRRGFPSVDSVYRSPSSSSHGESHQRAWFVFHHDLVLPEYIIDFQYISPLVPGDPLDHVMSCDPPHISCENGDDLLTPPVSVHPRLAMLDEATLLTHTRQSSLQNIRALNLHDNHLTRFRVSSSLPQLVKLVLSFNELTSAEDFHSMANLEYLDVSFNKLSSLEGMKTLPKLLHLDISWNDLSGCHREVNTLHKHTPQLHTLDASHNPWNKPGLFRSYALAHLKALTTFNGFPASQDEVSQALRQIVSSHISMATLLSHAHTAEAPPPSLSLHSIAHTVFTDSRPAQISGNGWGSKVTSVRVCGLGVRRLSCLDQLPNLRWLSLADNVLTSLEGLTLCSQLEELVLDGNLITTLAGVEGLRQLRWLSLAGNNLSTLPSSGLQGLDKLEHLNISNNSVSSLQGMKYLVSLSEFYASGNSVSSSRELFQLKPIHSLVVVDLTGNPICEAPSYRAFTVYHLSALRALDGHTIEATELSSAKEKLGGRLTQDFMFEKQPDTELSSLVTFDLPQCGLKCVDLGPVSVFDNLVSLNLEHNSLTSFSGLVLLSKLKVLCLNHNRVECLLHSRDYQPPMAQVMHSLEVLHLAYNGIGHMAALQFSRIPSLRALFLQGNEIVHVDGLEGLDRLSELVLDRNKIKCLQQGSFASQSSLCELHIEENRLKDLSHFSPLLNLERLYLGMNRIQEFGELEKLGCLQRLIELSVVSNPVSRRLQHRSLLIYHLPSLLSLDGVMVSGEERRTSEMAFSTVEDQEVDAAPELPLSGLASAAPLRVMNIPFGSLGHTHHQRRQHNLMDDNVLGFHDNRRRGRR